jgi:predicted anti-sigma-YlaC factor YlaD
MPGSVLCERVRAQVSLQLDGELSELEARMLDAHLVRCADCSAYAHNVRSFTQTVRAAPLESPSVPVVVHRPRKALLGRFQVAATAALALVAVGIASQLAPARPQSVALTEPGVVTQFQTRFELEQELAIIELVRTRTATSSSAYML